MDTGLSAMPGMRRKVKQLPGMRQACKGANCFIHKKTLPTNESGN
jgi:hypothetical protein